MAETGFKKWIITITVIMASLLGADRYHDSKRIPTADTG